MKTFLNIFGATLIALSIIAMAGAAGDCDGKCMENAHPLWLMATIMFGALAGLGLGAVMQTMAGRH